MSGVIGILSSDQDVSLSLYHGMYAIQHRGQDSMGISTIDKEKVNKFFNKGTISDNLTGNDMVNYKGNMGLGHVHNGNYAENKPLKQPYVFEDGSIISIDGKIINKDFTVYKLKEALCSGQESIIDYVSNLEGAFSLIYMKDNTMIVIRDKRGIKPISIATKGHNFIASSETCAFDGMGASWYKDLIPGEIFIVDSSGPKSLYVKSEPHELCLFEMFYTQRPDSLVEGVSVYGGRYKSGELLYKEYPTKADIVIGAPDSGLIAAQGYAEAGKIPYRTGLIKNRYVGRTFINPTEDMRNMDIRLKLNAIRDVVVGKDLILVDDSIVRGSTIKRTVEILRQAGAKTIHVRVASPPLVNGDNLSINIPDKDDLIASGKSLSEIEKEIGCNSLYYLSLEGLRESFGNKGYYEKYFQGDDDGN